MNVSTRNALWALRISGLEVASDVALPGAFAVTEPSAAPDVIVRRVAAINAPATPSVSGPNWALRDQRFFLQVPTVARFLITGGREIEICVEPGVREEDALVFLLGTALGVLLYQRGQLVLHASAVLVGDRAVLFMGRSGAGKSTLAAALDLQGYPIVNDDVCRIDFDPQGRPVVQPDGRTARLWQDTVDHLQLRDRKGAPVRSGFDKFYVEPATVSTGGAIPLAAIYGLREQRPPFEYGIEPIARLNGAQILRRNLYRQHLVGRMGLSADLFAKSNALQDQAALHQLTRPFNLGLMPDTVSQLEAHWSHQGFRP